ncbi:MAG: alkaline phosphatase family protein, partial [Stellaceae bacterium]
MHRSKLLCSVAGCALWINCLALLPAAAAPGANDGKTATPIKHVIVIIGENRTFDHLFATYKPVNKNETVFNLLSEKIIKADGTPGKNYSSVAQLQAQNKTAYQLSPSGKAPYAVLPAPLAGGGYGNGAPPFASIADAVTYENGLPPGYYKFLTTGAVPASILGKSDIRIFYNGRNVNRLPPGPYQLTPGVPYDAYAESPVHRFYQMWQQLDCSTPEGCRNDLFAWVEATVGAGSNGKPPPAGFTYQEGATALGFYNVQQGDMPYFKMLADTYSMSDNFHQAVNGGTGAN